MSSTPVVLPPSAATSFPLDGATPDAEGPPAGGAVVDYEPFLPDQKYHKTSPPKLLTVTEEQDVVYREVFKHFAAEDYAIPDIKGGDGGLTEEERFYLTHECFLRFLRATGWNAANCIKKLEATLKWRREYGIYDTLTVESIKEHCLNGKVIVFGYDVDGRPGFLDIAGRESSPEGPGRVQTYVWMMERAVEIMPRGVESVAVLVLYSGTAKATSFGHARLVVDTLQSYYPERLGRCLVNNGPFWLTILMKLIDPFLDQVTRSKIAINRDVLATGDFTPDQVCKEWGGERELVWECERYLDRLVEISGKMKERRFAKWRELGGKVGLREWDYKEE